MELQMGIMFHFDVFVQIYWPGFISPFPCIRFGGWQPLTLLCIFVLVLFYLLSIDRMGYTIHETYFWISKIIIEWGLYYIL